MAQNVTVAGASYSAVPSLDLPKTGGGTSSFYDVSGTTATASDVAQGKVFYAANGALTTGTASGGGSGVSVFYGTCGTNSGTAAKVVVCEEFTSDYLVEGTVIYVKFTLAQMYNGALTLNVNSTGAKNIKRVGAVDASQYEWQAGELLCFVYDGSYWCLVDGGIATQTYYGVTKLSSATNSTSNAVAATSYAVKAAYDLASGRQAKLISGTNIKTINNQSLLGSGNISISGGSGGSWTAVSGVTAMGEGDAYAYTDGNLVYVTASELHPNESGELIMGLPETTAGVRFDVLLHPLGYPESLIAYMVELNADTIAILDTGSIDPSIITEYMTSFTITYPIISS